MGEDATANQIQQLEEEIALLSQRLKEKKDLLSSIKAKQVIGKLVA